MQEDKKQIEEEEVTSVKGTTSLSEALLASATCADSAVTKQFKCTETFTAPNGIMKERDVYYLLPTTALSLPNPENYSLGLTYGKERSRGVLFTGQNRKARRTAEKKNRAR